MAAVPETDLARIKAFCDAKVPAHVRDQVRIESRVRGRTVTIVECRPPWTDQPDQPWVESPVARMKYDPDERGWTLYWFDRNSKAHRYVSVRPNLSVVAVLDEVDRDPTAIFWG